MKEVLDHHENLFTHRGKGYCYTYIYICVSVNEVQNTYLAMYNKNIGHVNISVKKGNSRI